MNKDEKGISTQEAKIAKELKDSVEGEAPTGPEIIDDLREDIGLELKIRRND